jgi:hypothetical protein
MFCIIFDMKRRFLAIFSVLTMFFGAFLVVSPAYADPGTAPSTQEAKDCRDNNTSVLRFTCDENGIWGILEMVLDIFTYGVGILAIGALVFAGIKYSIAGGSEEKVRAAKKMIFDTVIGLLCYAVLYAALKWLLLGW